MSKAQPKQPSKLKPRQLKRQMLQELDQSHNPQPEPRPELVQWKPLG